MYDEWKTNYKLIITMTVFGEKRKLENYIKNNKKLTEEKSRKIRNKIHCHK